jgi:cation diffusion facilitator family transporter
MEKSQSTKMTDWLIRVFRLDHGDRKKNYGYFEGILSIVINILLFFMKFAMGTVLNSVSLKADSFHTLSDVITSVLVIVGFYVAARPPDDEHPFGHGRAEKIFSILIAAILVFVGVEFFFSSYIRFKNPVAIGTNLVVIILLALSILAKEFLTLVSLNLGQRINSASLKADAWHHRSDAIATAFVVLAFISFRFGVYRLDGALGMAVSVLIAYTGIAIIREASSSLMGQAAPTGVSAEIRSIAESFDFVKDVHHIHVHDYGGNLEITLHIRLEKNLHLDNVHKKASLVEKTIKEKIKNAEVTVHTEPMYKDKPKPGD